VTWESIITPQPEYGQQIAALTRGGSMPDCSTGNPSQNAAATIQGEDQAPSAI